MNFNYFEVFIAISSDNIQTLVGFYSQFFQKQPTVYRPLVYAEFRLENLRLAIFKPKSDNQLEFENLGSNMSICIEVEDLQQAIATITNLGYPPSGKIIEASHGQELYAYDPDGNRLIIHQPKSS